MVKRSYLEYVYFQDDERNCLSRKRKSYNPVIFALMMYLLFFKSSIARGDLFGSKAHQKGREAAFHKADDKPVYLSKDEGYYKDGKWGSAPEAAEAKKEAPAEPPP
ncbi:MAG: hypothetical protein ABSB94_20440 [Syntrophorhabdales bacterium]|jgi:hypothetical protein